MRYCTGCGAELPVPAGAFCVQCGVKIQAIEEPQEVILSESSPSRTNAAPNVLLNPELQFLANAKTGLTRWWRWVLGAVLIAVIWNVIGSVPNLVACQYLINSPMSEFTCSGFTITGDSVIPEFVLKNYMFVIGIIGVWLVVKLLHKKTLTATTTGRVAFDYNRVIFAIAASLFLNIGILLLYGLPGEMTFQWPNPWEYLTYFLFAIVLTPYQAGFEEIFFRGYIIQGISHFTRNKWYLALMSAFIFVLPHLGNPEPWAYGLFPYVYAIASMGIFFALLTLFDGGIELACGCHALNNLWIMLIMSQEVTVLPSFPLFILGDEVSTIPYIVEVITYLLLFTLFNHKYKWFRWKAVWDKLSTN